ncbi:MAG TPA: hypothetical protein VF043_34730 [Ktedonobacteraceae bacterium]
MPGFLLGLGSRSVVIDKARSSFHRKSLTLALCLITTTGGPLLPI